MSTASLLVVETLLQMLSAEKKLLLAGAVAYSPLFFVLVRFYGMLQRRRQGKVLDWDWQAWLEDIDDDQLRFQLRVALENDEALREGGLLDSNGQTVDDGWGMKPNGLGLTG